MTELSDMPGGLDELAVARLGEGRRILAGIVGEYDVLLATAIAERDALRSAQGPAAEALHTWRVEIQHRLPTMPVEQRRCLLFALAERLSAGGEQYSEVARWFHWLTSEPLNLVAGDVRLLAVVAEPGDNSHGYEPFEFVVDMVEDLLGQRAAGAAALAEAVADQVLGWNPLAYHYSMANDVLTDVASSWRFDPRQAVTRVRDKALELAGRPLALPALEGPVGRDDGYGLAVIGWLGMVEDWPAGVRALLELCSAARAPRPGPRWEKDCKRQLTAVENPAALLRHLLELVLATEPVGYLTDDGRRQVLVGFNEQLIKGVIWATGVLNPPWLPGVLREVATRCLRLCSGHVFRDTSVPGEKIAYACFRALAMSGSDASLTALARIGRATSNGSVRKNLARTLEEASAKRGVSSASLLDRLTPDHELGPEGSIRLPAGGTVWTIRLDDLRGAVVDGPPESEVPGEVADVAAEIKGTVAAVRERLDALFADRREWHIDDFTEDYVRHPLTGWLVRRLVWTFTQPDGRFVRGFPGSSGDTVRTARGTEPAPAGSLVQLTHPVQLDPDELAELRALGQEQGVSQPIRQLWRETYQLTGAERDTGLFTGRYSGHVLRFSQCYGVARRRGWTGGFLSGAWDGGQSAVACRDYPSAGLRASWAIAELDQRNTEIPVDLCVTENVSFSPLHDAIPAPIPLADVPPEVFSEAMRDLDLVVSVSTVANDPTWLDHYHGQPVLDRYWRYIADGGLEQLRVHRRAILTPYCDGEELRDRYQLTDTDLIVRGSLASYRIDLATANARMEPAGKWLSFDTKHTPAQAHQHHILGLPAIDDDEILHRILIRAAILADDEHLASRKLVKQIRG